jgi:hypothetical protein
MRNIAFAVSVLIIIVCTSGCVGEKTVIKAAVTISEAQDNPVIDEVRVTTEQVSITKDYSQETTHFPGVYMICICNEQKITNGRSVVYHGAGEYEIISEPTGIPEKGDSIEVTIRVVDINATELVKEKKTIVWE